MTHKFTQYPRCPLCDCEKTLRYYHDPNTPRTPRQSPLTLYKCTCCGVKFQHPMPTETELALAYRETFYENRYTEAILLQQEKLFERKLALIETFIDKHPNGGGSSSTRRLLDVGAGMGVFLKTAVKRLQKHGWQCFGQDVSQAAAAHVKAATGIDITVSPDLSEQWFKSDSEDELFDIVHMNHVLEHLPSPPAAITQASRLLKRGGLLCCEVPLQSNAVKLLYDFYAMLSGLGHYRGTSAMPEPYYEPFHLYIFDSRSLRFLVQRYGSDRGAYGGTYGGGGGLEIIYEGVEGLDAPHRMVRGVHYDGLQVHLLVELLKVLKPEIPLGGGNLTIIARRTRL